MRIVYFTDTYYPEINGVTNTLSKLHDYLDSHGIDHIFFTPEYHKEEPQQEIYRFRGFQIPFSPNSRLAVMLPHHAAIRKQIADFKPDLIHIITEFTMGQEGLRIARELGIPIVMSFHTNIEQYLEFFHAKLLEAPVRAYFKHFHDYARLNLCPSMQTLRQLRQQGYSGLDLWTRGVDTQLYSPGRKTDKWREKFGKNKFLCLYVGRLSYEKGIDYYIEAIRELNELGYGSGMEFIFAGDGPYREVLEACNISNIHLTGFVRGEELARLYADVDAFVFPSGTETFGNVLLEAMASALPCICVDEGGVTDFAQDGRNALVVPYRDGSAIAEALLKLMDNPLLRERLRIGARKTAQERSWDGVMDKLLASYEEVLEAEILHGLYGNGV